MSFHALPLRPRLAEKGSSSSQLSAHHARTPPPLLPLRNPVLQSVLQPSSYHHWSGPPGKRLLVNVHINVSDVRPAFPSHWNPFSMILRTATSGFVTSVTSKDIHRLHVARLTCKFDLLLAIMTHLLTIGHQKSLSSAFSFHRG